MNRGLAVLFVVFFLFAMLSPAEEVSKFRYLLKPESLNNKTIQLSSDKVALAEFIAAGDSSSSTIQAGDASVFFIIDNSASMYNTQWSDIMGERFTVVNALIDSFNTFNPDIEVGVAVFQDNLLYNPADDQIIEDASGHAYGFIPLLKLGERYESTVLGNVTGYEILKHYMAHTQYSGGVYPSQLLYKNPNVDPRGTNINSGFSAAKQAFSNASYVPESQFIMFLSDGLQEGGTDEYVQGKNTPTTFTIYMSTSKTVPIPDKLITMTENIKTNGYSNTNSKSVIHLIEKGENEILAWTLDNVLTTIFDLYKFIPQKIIVNGITNTTWQNGGFDFGTLFPLTGEETPFTFEIDYKYYLNDVYKGDTTHIIDFVAKVTPAAIEENIETRKWGRDLELYYNNSKITEITPEMKELEIRFTPYKVDTVYGYSNVEVEIYTDNLNPDGDTLILTQNGNYFSNTFSRENVSAVVGDKKLQLKPGDNLIAVFRNAELPLDTLKIELTSSVPDEAILNSAMYYDNNADGHVDSLFLDISGADLEIDLDSIVSNISLPYFRILSIDSYNKNGEGIGLTVSEGISDIYTYVTNDDILEIKKDIVLPSGAPLNSATLKIIDSVAPVIIAASLIDSVKASSRDFLTVTFSENVKSINESVPFIFYGMPGNSDYNATLSIISQTGLSSEFQVLSINGEANIDNGDSININWNISNNISDELSNKQSNKANRKVEIDVTLIEEGINVTGAYYYDENADGFIDKVTIDIYGEYINENLNDIIDAINLPINRGFEIVNYSYLANKISINVNQQIGTEDINTAVNNDDLLSVSKSTLPYKDMILLGVEIQIEDRMAPVIISASLIDSVKEGANDLLTINFSENVKNIEHENPFYFYTQSNSIQYNANLKVISLNNKTAKFKVVSIDGADEINNGDSVNINWGINDPVSDLLTTTYNSQTNSENRKVQVDVTVIADGVIVEEVAYFDENADGKIDLIKIGIDLKDLDGLNLVNLVNALQLPKDRNLYINSYMKSITGLDLLVTQSISDSEIITSVNSSDILIIKNIVSINNEIQLLPSEVLIADSMAPVILKALIIDSLNEDSRDELIITYSEEIEQKVQDEPIAFFTDEQYYNVELEINNQNSSSTSYWVKNIIGKEVITEGDSVRINWIYDDNIGDKLKNNQNNSENRSVELEIIEIPDSYKLITKSIIFKDNNKLKLNDDIWEIDKLKDLLGKHDIGNNTVKGLTIITLTPDDTTKVTEYDSLTGVISIYDAVGNEVLGKRSLVYDRQNNRLLFLWDGKNNYGRSIGSASYLALINYSVFYKNNIVLTEDSKAIVGVKRNK